MASKKNRLTQRLKAATATPEKVPAAPIRPPEPAEPPVEFAAFVGAVVIGIAIITGLAIFNGTRAIEDQLETQTLGLLRDAGIRDVDVDADWLEVALYGTVRDEQHIAIANALARSVDGVVDVDVQNIVYVPPPPEVDFDIVALPLVFAWDDDVVTVSGNVSDEPNHDAVINFVSELWGVVIAEGLVVKEGIDSERAWLPSILNVVSQAGRELPEGIVVANASSSFVLVSGELESRRAQVALANEVEATLSILTFAFTSGLTVKEEPPPPVASAAPGSEGPQSATTTTTPTTTTTTTAPPPEVVELQLNLDELIEGKVVEFEFGSSVITEQGRLLLDEVLDALVMVPDVKVEISGHTDDVGSDQSNLLLSRLRAAAVLAYLVDRGELPTRFVVIGYGEAEPVADNSTNEGRARNRRIEFTALSE